MNTLFKVGQILVVRTDAPARFSNLKAGSLWKVVEVRNAFNGAITVGDDAHPRIRTEARYFTAIDGLTFSQLQGLEGTDIAYRLDAIDAFGPKSVFDGPEGFYSLTVNGDKAYVSNQVARALARKNPGKVVQRKLAQIAG